MKIILILLIILIVIIGILLLGAWSVFGDKISAANSVQKLDNGLYSMEYKGDYGLDKFLERGGAASDADVAEYVTIFLSGGFWQPETKTVPKDFGCSTLTVTNADNTQLMGRNYDWQDCDAMIIHTKPKNGYESISTCCLDFLGFGTNWKPEGMQNQYMALAAIYVPLDGMNEKGLCVADLISGDEAQTHQNTEKADLTITSAIRLLLDKAATVEEAVALLEQYDMNSSIGTSHHLAISDTSGKAVVVEYINDEMIVTETPVVTNHYLSAGEKYGVGNAESHQRFDKLIDMKKSLEDTMTPNTLRDCMSKVSYDTYTQWSIIYDKTNLSLDFYWKRNYDTAYTFKLNP